MLRREHYSWVYIVAVIFAVISSFVTIVSATATATILAILGIVLGIANVSRKEATGFLVASVSLIVASLAAKGLEDIVFIGTYVPGVLVNLVSLFAPAAIVVSLKALNEAGKEK